MLYLSSIGCRSIINEAICAVDMSSVWLLGLCFPGLNRWQVAVQEQILLLTTANSVYLLWFVTLVGGSAGKGHQSCIFSSPSNHYLAQKKELFIVYMVGSCLLA